MLTFKLHKWAEQSCKYNIHVCTSLQAYWDTEHCVRVMRLRWCPVNVNVPVKRLMKVLVLFETANVTYIKRITMGFHKSTLVARGADTQLAPSCVSAPLATNVDLFAYFVERFLKSSSISYWLCRRVASGSLYVWTCRMCGQQTEQHAVCVVNRQNSENNAFLARNSIERPATFHRL